MSDDVSERVLEILVDAPTISLARYRIMELFTAIETEEQGSAKQEDEGKEEISEDFADFKRSLVEAAYWSISGMDPNDSCNEWEVEYYEKAIEQMIPLIEEYYLEQ